MQTGQKVVYNGIQFTIVGSTGAYLLMRRDADGKVFRATRGMVQSILNTQPQDGFAIGAREAPTRRRYILFGSRVPKRRKPPKPEPVESEADSDWGMDDVDDP